MTSQPWTRLSSRRSHNGSLAILSVIRRKGQSELDASIKRSAFSGIWLFQGTDSCCARIVFLEGLCIDSAGFCVYRFYHNKRTFAMRSISPNRLHKILLTYQLCQTFIARSSVSAEDMTLKSSH